MNMNSKNIDKLLSEVLAIEAEDARKAGTIGYMARALVQSTLPHSKVDGGTFTRKNGLFKLTILADPEVGVPYGSIPRLLLSWISTEAVRTNDRNLILGRTLSSFMSELDLIPTGGRWGTITRLKDQMERLFSSSISCTYDDGNHWAIRNVNPISRADLWWNPKQPEQATIFESTLTINEDFFQEITSNPIPIDIRVLKALKRSPLALDVYCWLTYRMSYLSRSSEIPWEILAMQFGSDYKKVKNFKENFIKQLKKVSILYNSNIEVCETGLLLNPSKPHIPRKGLKQ